MNRKRQSASLSDVRAQKIVLQKLCGKCDAAFLHAGADGAVVGFCDALGDGEADAEAAGRSGAGGVRPVEAIKQAVQRPVRG